MTDRRPDFSPEHLVVYDWFAANGVAEWIPEFPVIEVGLDTITYTSYVWPTDCQRGFNPTSDGRGFQPQMVILASGDAAIEWRTVPLRVWPGPEVATAAMLCGAALIDATVSGPSTVDAA